MVEQWSAPMPWTDTPTRRVPERPGRAYRVERLPPGRRQVLDLLRFAHRVPVIHGLLEVDVTHARRELRQRAAGATFTSFVVASVGRAVVAHPEINVRRAGRRLVRFDTTDIVVTAEHEVGGTSLPLPHIVRDAGGRSLDDIGADLRTARQRAADRAREPRPRTTLERLPSLVRTLGLRTAATRPSVAARLGPAIGVSSLGMFGSGIAWGVPVSPLTLMATVGSIGERVTMTDRGPAVGGVLALTLSFDHTVVDGAPAARFATTLRSLLEEGDALR
jgi:pyruvate/2-oxoglutarate dehydrogenase complex dihydrolipoamide acyltransferase (E2) component